MEHIKNIEIQNFKSIKHCLIDGCKRINVFVGPPNVGKSNILEAMGLFSFTNKISRSQNLNDYVRYETIASLFFEKNFEQSFKIKINENDTALEGLVNNKDGKKTFFLGHFNFNQYFRENQSKQFTLNENLAPKNFKDNHKVYKGYTVNENIIPEKFKDKEEFHSADIVNYDRLNPFKYENIKKYSFKQNILFQNYGGSEMQVPFGENIGSLLENSKDAKVIEFKKTLENEYNIESQNGEIILRKKQENGIITFKFNEIADTLQRLIFHLTAIMSNKDSVLLLEEPEAQMYPPYISKLTSEIIYDENKNQYFIATHSPFVLNDFLENAKEDLQIYIVDSKNGETIVQKMTDNEMHEAYQYGSSFFMNIPNFIKE